MKRENRLLSIVITIVLCVSILSVSSVIASAATILNIDKISITDVNVPADGDTLDSEDFQYTIPTDANYREGDGVWYESDDPIEDYSQFSAATELHANHEFKIGKYYTFLTILFSKSGYTFDENITDVTVNENGARHCFTGDTTDTIAVWYSFGPLKPEYAFEVSPKVLDFGKANEGYEKAPDAKTVTLTNNGANTYNFPIYFEDKNFELVPTSNVKLNDFDIEGLYFANAPVGGTATFTLQPKKGLAVGTYTTTITISGGVDGILEDFNEEITATFTVEKPEVIPQNPTPPTKTEIKAPQTADNSNIALCLALVFVSATVLIGCSVYGTRKHGIF